MMVNRMAADGKSEYLIDARSSTSPKWTYTPDPPLASALLPAGRGVLRVPVRRPRLPRGLLQVPHHVWQDLSLPGSQSMTTGSGKL